MKQAYFIKTGGPEVLKIREVPVPEPGKGEVLVHMIATSVNGGDVSLRRGFKEKKLRKAHLTGIDVVGVVEKTGAGVKDFRVGDMVWGNSGPGNGTAAEYFTIPAKKISLMPAGRNPTEMTALPTAGITAITAMLDVGKMKSGDHILIRGIGGVGLAAVQIARANGAHITALASDKLVDDVKAAGADEVYGYHSTSIDDLGTFDLIFDTVGSQLNDLRKHLKKDGRLVTIAVARMPSEIGSLIYGKRRTRLALAFSNHRRLDYLKKLVEENAVVPVIDSVYPLDQIAEAHKRAEKHGVFGKIVISIDPNLTR